MRLPPHAYVQFPSPPTFVHLSGSGLTYLQSHHRKVFAYTLNRWLPVADPLKYPAEILLSVLS